MKSGLLRVLPLLGPGEARGHVHGAAWPEGIRAYLADRMKLAGDLTWAGTMATAEQILAAAESTLEYHDRYEPGLFEEMGAMADAADLTPAEAVVVGGFTDLVDLIRANGIAIDECTMLIDPRRGVFAQTWDMHASAANYVAMLHIQPDSGPAAYVQTTMGCLGQIGMNEAGIGIGINNLTSTGRPGVTWPFVVRKVLQQSDFDDAIKCILDAPLAGGHNYAIIGPEGRVVNIEAMPGSQHVTRVDHAPFVHTNHCIDRSTRSEEGERAPEHVENSDLRLERGRSHHGDLEAFFQDPVISKPAIEPHMTATCGAVVMHPGERRMQSVWGVPGESPWEEFAL